MEIPAWEMIVERSIEENGVENPARWREMQEKNAAKGRGKDQ